MAKVCLLTIELDFYSESKCDYLSEYPDLKIDIPDPFNGEENDNPIEYEKLGFDIHFNK